MASWPGVLDPTLLKEEVVARNHRLADAAKAGRWAEVFEVLDLSWVSVNQWRLGGDSWFAPLHQAAWHGASTSVVTGLLERGALRSLPARDGRTPYDVAQARGHTAPARPPDSPGHQAHSRASGRPRSRARLRHRRPPPPARGHRRLLRQAARGVPALPAGRRAARNVPSSGCGSPSRGCTAASPSR